MPRCVGSSNRRLYRPGPVAVDADETGVPMSVGGAVVEAVREEWLVEDRWWTERPVRRRYFELITDAGRDTVVFFDDERWRWYAQRA